MTKHFDDERFRQLWRDGDEVWRLRARAAATFEERAVQSFDGLGHLLDHILPNDSESVRRVAEALRLSTGNLQRLRAGSIDPLMLPTEALAELGQATALSMEVFTALVCRDHERFRLRHVDAVPRNGIENPAENAIKALREAWRRCDSDSADEL